MQAPTGNGLRAKRDSLPRSERGFQGVRRSTPWLKKDNAHVAQLAERVLGKDEVTSSILVVGSRNEFGPGRADAGVIEELGRRAWPRRSLTGRSRT